MMVGLSSARTYFVAATTQSNLSAFPWISRGYVLIICAPTDDPAAIARGNIPSVHLAAGGHRCDIGECQMLKRRVNTLQSVCPVPYS